MKSTQSGDISNKTSVFVFLAILFILVCLIYVCIHTNSPYIWYVDYIYKSNYYKPFIQPEGYDVDTVGRDWCNWDVDEKGIATMASLFNNSAGYINTKKTYDSRNGLKLWEDWIVAFLTRLEQTDVVNPNFQGFPWGNNWYEFTISATTNLAYYIVNIKSSPAVKMAAAKAIQYILIDPQHSLGYERDKANSAMMLFPWTLSHMVTGTLDTSNPAYIYAVNQYNLAPSTTIKANEDGVHLDYAYLTHNGVYAYGYLWSIYNIYADTKQIIPEVENFNLDYHIDMIYSKLRHPTIDTAGCALWHRYFKLDGCGFYNGKTKTNKCEVIPSMRYIRYFDDNIHFSARAMQTTVAYYEADHTVDNMGLYSAMCRRVFHVDDDPVPRFPDVGFIYEIGTTELVVTESTNTTTTPFYCELQDNSEAWAWTDHKDYGLMRSVYMKLLPLLPKMYSEFLCIYLKEKIISIAYQIPVGYALFAGDREWERVSGNELDQNNGLVILNIDLEADTYTSMLSPYDHTEWLVEFTDNKYSANPIPGKLNAYYIHRYDMSGQPIIAYIPSEEDYILPEITTSNGKFILGSDNQYWHENYDWETQTFT